MGNEFPNDPQMELWVTGLLLLCRKHWEEMSQQLPIEQLYAGGTWGPTMAAKLATKWFFIPEPGQSCQLGTAAREAVLVQVATIMNCGPMANGSEAGLVAFFNSIFSGADRRLGFTNPGELMQAAVPYMGDLAELDLYSVAYRAARVVPQQNTEFPSILLNAWMALEVWPVFFQNMTFKKPLFG